MNPKLTTRIIFIAVAALIIGAFWNQPILQPTSGSSGQTGIAFFSQKSNELSKKVKELERQMTVLKKDGRPVGLDHIRRLWQELLGLWEKGALSRAKAMELYQLLTDIYWMGNPRSTGKETRTPEETKRHVEEKKESEVHGQAGSDIGSQVQLTKQEIDEITTKQGARLSEAHYDSLKKKLDYFAGQGITGLERYYQTIEERNPHTVAAGDKKQEADLAERKKRQENEYYDCPVNIPAPTFTTDFTTFSAIKMITPPGTLTSDRDVAKGHFWIWTGGARVPLYVPIDVVVEDVGAGPASAKDTTTHSTIIFKVKDFCGYKMRFAHITEPDRSLKEGDVLPAGSLVGYTIGNIPSGNWDIGFYNMLKDGELAKINAFGMHRHGVCLIDYYSSEKQKAYRALFDQNGPRRVCQY